MKDGVPGKIEVSMTHAQSPTVPQASSFGLSAEPGQLIWCNTVNIDPEPAACGAILRQRRIDNGIAAGKAADHEARGAKPRAAFSLNRCC